MARHDVVIIGAGPGGYVAAIRGAQLGFDVAVVEKEAALGGTCVRVGCIPSKALLESSERYVAARDHLAEHGVEVAGLSLDLATMQARKSAVVKQNTDGVAFLFKKNKITRYAGVGRLAGPHRVVVDGADDAVELEATHVVLATGSVAGTLPGIDPDGHVIGTSTEALSYDSVPATLVVIGAGAIGLELGSVWSRLGSRVTVVEYLDRILPGMDEQMARSSLRVFERQGMAFRLGTEVTGVTVTGRGAKRRARLEVADGESLEAHKVLVAIGRRATTEGLGLDDVGVSLDSAGRVQVDDAFRTNVEGVYAIGDVIHGPMLAHKAEHDGVALMESLATGHGHVDYDLVPSVVYTEPEIAAVGQTEESLVAADTPFRTGTYKYAANGRARVLGQTAGSVKILAHAESDRILGVHIVGARAGDLIAEAVAAMTFGATAEDLARTVHAHPTLAEMVGEAAMAVEGRSIHS